MAYSRENIVGVFDPTGDKNISEFVRVVFEQKKLAFWDQTDNGKLELFGIVWDNLESLNLYGIDLDNEIAKRVALGPLLIGMDKIGGNKNYLPVLRRAMKGNLESVVAATRRNDDGGEERILLAVRKKMP